MDTKKVLAFIMGAVAILALFGMTVWAVRAYQSPLGPALEPTLVPTAVVVDGQIIIPTEAPTEVSVLAQAEVCGETGAWNVLVLGSDAADLRGDKGSDLTRMVRVDFSNRKVSMFAFSRDLWVDTTGLGLTNPTINAAKLGMVFYEGRNRSTSANVQDSMVAGTNATARMLANNFLVSSDHYMTIDLSQIPGMIDAIGGLPIDIPDTITDPWIGMTIQAGQQTLNGAQFVAYARAIPDSDLARIQRNSWLLLALQQKLLDPSVWGRIPDLYAQYKDVIATDLSPEQINHLQCMLQEVPREAIVMDGVQPEWTSPGPKEGSLNWDKTTVLDRMRELDLIP